MALTVKKTSSSIYVEDTITFSITGGSISSSYKLWVAIPDKVQTGSGELIYIANAKSSVNVNLKTIFENGYYAYHDGGNDFRITDIVPLEIRVFDNNSGTNVSNILKLNMKIKPQPPTFNYVPSYSDNNNDMITYITGNNEILVNGGSTIDIGPIAGTAYKNGTLKSIEVNGTSTFTYNTSSIIGNYINNYFLNNSEPELSLVLIDSRGWRSEKLTIADASKIKYKFLAPNMTNCKIERDGISETVKLEASGYYCEGYQLGQNPIENNYSWKESSASSYSSLTPLTLIKTPTTAWTNFNDIIDEYENPQYATEDNIQYYTGTQWNNGISDLFDAAISYNNKYTQAYLETDYDSVNDRYRVISGGYNGSWHNFWLDTIKAIYNTMYGQDGYGGNYEWKVEEVAIQGDLATGFTMNKSFYVMNIIAYHYIIGSNKATIYIDTAIPAIDIYKNNIAIHGLYDENLGGTQIEGDLLADFVTEFDNNGTWAWRKWHSGWVELFTYHQFTGLNLTSSSAGTYYGTAQTIDLPFKLVDFFYANGQETSTRTSGVYVYDISLKNNNTKISTSFRAHASSSNASCGVKYYILGTYK